MKRVTYAVLSPQLGGKSGGHANASFVGRGSEVGSSLLAARGGDVLVVLHLAD